MYPYIHIVLPSYGTFAVLGGIAVMIFLFFRIDKYNIHFSDFLKMFALCVVYGAIGSRIVFVVSRIPWIVSNFSLKALISTILGGGFVFYGGLLGVLFGLYRYSKKHGLNRKSVNNMVVPAIPLFHFIGRIGCFLSGCCYGYKLPSTTSLFGILTIDRFPTQIVEAIFNLLLFLIIVISQKKKPQLNWLKIYLFSYAVFRFIIEFARGDAIRGMFLGVSTSQIISLAIIGYSCLSEVIRKRKEKTE